MAIQKNTRAAAPKKRPAPVKKTTTAVAAPKNDIIISSSPFWNIWDTGTQYKVRMSIPGLTKKNIKVDVKGDGITISSQKEDKSQMVKKNYLVREYIYNSWSKSFTLPQKVNTRTVNIRYKDGVLKIDLQKIG